MARKATGRSSSESFTLHVGDAVFRPEIDPGVLFLDVPDARGMNYLAPWLQQEGDLYVSATFADRDITRVQLRCADSSGAISEAEVTPSRPSARFRGLKPGEYTLSAHAEGRQPECPVRTFSHIGVGAIIAALGDGITEGYFGNGFEAQPPLTASLFPAAAVSRDGRNFPQYAPTAETTLPMVNCLQSWMSELNDLLAAALGRPVLIANEGWGGSTAASYLEMMESDANWQHRMRLLKPQAWLIHLGVEDERRGVAAADYVANLGALADKLVNDYGADPARILIAKPSYDYNDGAREVLMGYNKAIDKLVAERGLGTGPNFFLAFRQDRARWYGADNVFPNVNGIRHMAELWRRTIVKVLAP